MSKRIPQPRVFVSHSSDDKEFVRKLVGDLQAEGLAVWFDETEIGVGESIVSRISEALADTNYLIVVLSAASVASRWVQQELNVALMREISQHGMLVLPVKIDDCTVPAILQDRLYADFRTEYQAAFQKLRKVFRLEPSEPQVSETIGEVLGPPPFRGPPSASFDHCRSSLSNLGGHDLRRKIQSCLQLKQLRITWHAVFGERMEDFHPNADLPTCAFEMVLKAEDWQLADKLKEELCKDYSASFNAKG